MLAVLVQYLMLSVTNVNNNEDLAGLELKMAKFV